MAFGRNFLSSVFNFSDVGFIVVDQELKIVQINDFMLKNFETFSKERKAEYINEFFPEIKIKKVCGENAKCNECTLINGICKAITDNIKINDIIISQEKSLVKKYYRLSINPVKIYIKKYAVLSFIDITESKNLENNLLSNQNKYRMLFDNMTQGFALCEAVADSYGTYNNYRYIEINPAYEKLTGLKAEEIKGKTVKEVIPNISPDWIDRYLRVALTGEPCYFEDYFPINKKYYNVWAFCPEPGKFAISFFDVTEKKTIEKELSASQHRLNNYIENTPDGVFITNLKGKYKEVNEAACKITGYSREELLNQDIFMLTPPEYHREWADKYNNLKHKGAFFAEIPFITKNNERRIWSIDALRLSDDEYINFQKDITDKMILQEKLKYYSYHDNLTGLFNRRYINQIIGNFENPELLPLSIIVGDINGLKVVNDAFGHNYGDKLIISMAEIVKSVCRENDIIAKWGGDEFMVIMPHSGIERINKTIAGIKEGCANNKTSDITLSISFGYAVKQSPDVNFESVLKAAEDMMLKNKIYESASFRSQTINLILKTLHEKNKREEQHSIRVSKICEAIGKAMGFLEYDINKLRVIGLVHDIGKIGINENILNKTGRLTDAEYSEIKKHPEIGYRILSLSNETSELAQHILSHHERYDGNGYPNGLKGESLSSMTKILTVADSYDAMTSERPYKNPMTKEEAIDELKRCSAKQFDPVIVDIFINKVLMQETLFDKTNQ